MKTTIKQALNAMELSDIYSLMLFALFKIKDIPDYAIVSEMCYLLDGSNMTRLLTYFAGKTVTFPTDDEMSTVANALLLYQYINIDGDDLVTAQRKLEKLTPAENDKVLDLYLKLLPVMKQYNIDRSQVQNHG